MKLEEAIKRYEEQANLLEESAAGCDMTDKVEKEIACRSGKCAAEHRQLAEWLKELKAVQDIIKQAVIADNIRGEAERRNDETDYRKE